MTADRTAPAAVVWYVSYGSNMAAARLAAYLRGGVPPGSTRHHRGARDPSDPMADGPCTLPHRRLFAGNSRTWGGGGVAFLDPEPGSGVTPARRYLLSMEQFHDVWAQESGRAIGRPVDPLPLDPGAARVVGDGGYDRLLVVGRDDGVAMVTFTSPRPVASLTPNPPSAPYRAMLVAGLCECHGMTAAEAHALIDAESGA